jgi:hypothetical protein
MKYLIRSVKYFIYFSVLCTAIITALVLIGAVEGDINSIFSEGYNSIGKIVMFFAIVAAVYPKFGFITRDIVADKDWKDIRPQVLEYMYERSYKLESEKDGVVTFRFKSAAGRLSKMYEDRLTLTRTETGYQLEGLRKDVMRLAMGLEYRLNPKDTE